MHRMFEGFAEMNARITQVQSAQISMTRGSAMEVEEVQVEAPVQTAGRKEKFPLFTSM